MAIGDINPSKREIVFFQRSDDNLKYHEVHVSGSGIIFFTDGNGYLDADTITSFFSTYGGVTSTTSSFYSSGSGVASSSYIATQSFCSTSSFFASGSNIASSSYIATQSFVSTSSLYASSSFSSSYASASLTASYMTGSNFRIINNQLQIYGIDDDGWYALTAFGGIISQSKV